MNKKLFIGLYLLTLISIFLLPFYLFNGKIFIGGDDTRLLYIYPWEWLQRFSLYSWFHFGSYGANNPNQALLPFLTIWSIVSWLIPSKVILDYLSYSLPLILGFIFFQKLLNEIVQSKNNEYKFIYYVGALIYVLSPILQENQLPIFLYAAWLIGLLPCILYYFLRYLKTGNFVYVIINVIWCIALSFSISTIPWLLGFFFPLTISLLVLILLFPRDEIRVFVKRMLVFFLITIFSQAFWVYSFIINSLFPEKNSFIGTALSKQVSDTFSGTVLANTGQNIIYPLLNLFHRQMSVQPGSQLRYVFFNFYDKTLFLDIIFVLIIFVGILNFKKYFSKSEKHYYLFFLVAFLLALFFFTVNMGPLVYVFLMLGHIPGFVMFRNFYDKFAPGYTLLYSIFLTLSLVVSIRRFTRIKILLPLIVFLIVLVNCIPIKEVVYRPIWTTKDIYTAVLIPSEYTNFMNQVQQIVPQTTNILSLPYNIAGYTMIKDQDTNNIFAGRSPVQLFTGINDFSGDLSFSSSDSERVNHDLLTRNYTDFNQFLILRNINYIFVTNNIPAEIKNSYLFNALTLSHQDKKFLNAITSKKILVSNNGNYTLYKTKHSTSLFISKNLTFEKINEDQYKLYFKNIKEPQELDFIDSFSGGWKLYPQVNTSYTKDEFMYLFKKDIFANSHSVLNGYANRWVIDPYKLKENFNSDYYSINPDGSINMVLTLYFKPQENFYIGAFITGLTVAFCFCYLIIQKRRK